MLKIIVIVMEMSVILIKEGLLVFTGLTLINTPPFLRWREMPELRGAAAAPTGKMRKDTR